MVARKKFGDFSSRTRAWRTRQDYMMMCLHRVVVGCAETRTLMAIVCVTHVVSTTSGAGANGDHDAGCEVKGHVAMVTASCCDDAETVTDVALTVTHTYDARDTTIGSDGTVHNATGHHART